MSEGNPRLVNYGVAALILALYASLSAWMVAGEGDSYRRSIAKKGDIAIVPQPDPTEPPKSPATPAPRPVPPPQPAPTPEPAPPPTVIPQPKPPEPKPAPPPRPVDTPRPSVPPKAVAQSKNAPPVDFFWDEPAQQKVWDVEHLTVNDERALGLALNEMVLHDHPKVKTNAGYYRKRLLDAAKPYLAARSRTDLEYTFTVLDCPRMNVFSHPGGYIYVCKGLFDWIPEDKDYALEFLVAHEIRHVDQAHAITCLKSPGVKELKLGTVTMFYAVVIPAGFYPESMDYDADRWAAQQMVKAGRSRLQVLAFLRRLQDYAKLVPENNFENDRKKPNEEPKVPLLDNHIRAHPAQGERIDALKELIDGPPKS